MALNPKISTTAANAEADATVDLLDNGYLRIYSGTQAVDADTAIGAQVLLAELRFGTPAFGAAASSVATANAITPDTAANATGTATWFRCLKADGTTVIFDGSIDTVAAGNANILLDSVAIQINADVTVTSLTYTRNKG